MESIERLDCDRCSEKCSVKTLVMILKKDSAPAAICKSDNEKISNYTKAPEAKKGILPSLN